MDDSEILEKLRSLEEEVKKRKTRTEQASYSPPKKRRRCVIYSSSDSDHDLENEDTNVPKNDSAASDNDLISVLGEDPTLTIEFGGEIRSTMAVRWNNILQKGIKKDQRSDLIKKYLPPANCTLVAPPTLNDEIKAAVQETAVKRDSKLEQKQVQLGAGITCIGKAMDVAMKIGDKNLRDEIIKYLGDGGQVLTDLHFLDTLTRRSLLMQGLNKNTKDAIKDLQRDKLLFGEGLPDKLKAIKACSKSAADLKARQPRTSTSRHNNNRTSGSTYNASDALNWRGTSRQSTVGAWTAGANAYRGYRDQQYRRPAAAAAAAAPAALRRTQSGPRYPSKRS